MSHPSFHSPHRSGSRGGRPYRGTVGAALLALSTAFLGACDNDEPPPTAITSETFITIMVELREAERATIDGDSAGVEFEQRKAEILDRHGTTEEEIREYVRIASRDLPHLNALWDSISRQLRHERTLTEPQ